VPGFSVLYSYGQYKCTGASLGIDKIKKLVKIMKQVKMIKLALMSLGQLDSEYIYVNYDYKYLIFINRHFISNIKEVLKVNLMLSILYETTTMQADFE
jgi:hypothetical protein